MKKIIQLLLLLFIPFGTYSQDIPIKETKVLFEIINCKELVNTLFDSIKSNLINNTKNILEEEGLENNKKNIQYYHNHLNEDILYYSDLFYKELLEAYYFKNSKDEILEYIKIAKKQKKNVLLKIGMHEEVRILENSYKKYFSNEIEFMARKLKGVNGKLKLILYVNNKITMDYEIDLVLNLKTDSSINILNKKTHEILLPVNFNYDLIESLSIKFNNEEYNIDKYPSFFPENLKELSSPLTKYNFVELPKWIIQITDEQVSFESRVEIRLKRKKC